MSTLDFRPPLAASLRHITKRFGNVIANDDVSIAIERGSIHGIIGENGAGKSTLMSILYGFQSADSGEIVVDARPVVMRSPLNAIQAGIGMVHQHFMLVDTFTVLENVVLGAEGGALIGPGMARARSELERLERDHQLDVPPDARVADLPVGIQQRVEILKALYRKAKILILDEPTGVLTPQEARRLFDILRGLKAQGTSVVLITHKLREVMDVTDTITVMRSGRVVASVRTVETNEEQLATLMVGRNVSLRVNKQAAVVGAPVLAARNIALTNARGVRCVHDVSFTVREGEIVGIAGVSGSGQSELLLALAGMMPPLSGHVLISGEDLYSGGRADPRRARALGVGHVPEDRHRDGLVKALDAAECAILGFHREAIYNGPLLLKRRAILQRCAELMSDYDVRPRAPRLPMGNFSGGNQQKLIVGREVRQDPKVLLVGQPTRGVDIGAIEAIHRRIVAMRDAGKAIVLVSSELEELRALSDRILVMFNGTVIGEVTGDTAEDELGLLMTGLTAA